MEFYFQESKKNIKNRMSVEHAKIISNIFTSRLARKTLNDKISFNHTMYDGSSGFQSWGKPQIFDVFLAAQDSHIFFERKNSYQKD
jgi:hypothetical protein